MFYSGLRGAFALSATILFLSVFNVFGQGTAFSYQGQLSRNGVPATGLFDLAFSVYDNGTNGNLLGGPVTNAAVSVSNGLFHATVDFGPGVFIGQTRWLAVSARTNGAAGFTPLASLQAVVPVPYAIFAAGASNLTGTVPASQITGILTNSTTGNAATASVASNLVGVLPVRQLPASVMLTNTPVNASQFLVALDSSIGRRGTVDSWNDEPFGINTWFMYGAGITESLITNQVLARINGSTPGELDWRRYKQPVIQIDEGMFNGVDTNGLPTVDPVAWPHGFPWLCSLLHSNGFKVGVWIQGTYGMFCLTMGNPVTIANYLVTNHVDYVKLDAVDDYMATPLGTTGSELAAEFIETMRAAPYPVHISGAIEYYGNDWSPAISLYDSYRGTACYAFSDQLGFGLGGDLVPWGRRPVMQWAWVDIAMALRNRLSPTFVPDFDPAPLESWPDTKRQIALCTFFSSPFNISPLGPDFVHVDYGCYWSNLLTKTTAQIWRDNFSPSLAGTNNGVYIYTKGNYAGGLDVLLLNRNYREFAGTNQSPSRGPGLLMDVCTNNWFNNGTNYCLVFWSTNLALNFAALGLSPGVGYSCFHAETDGRCDATNGLNVYVPAASAELFHLVPQLPQSQCRDLSHEAPWWYTNYCAYSTYPYYGSFQGGPQTGLLGTSQIYSNGIEAPPSCSISWGLNGCTNFSATFGRATVGPAFYNTLTFFLDNVPVAQLSSFNLTNFSLYCPPTAKVLRIDSGNASNGYWFMMNPVLQNWNNTYNGTFSGSFTGDGSGLANLSTTNLVGTIAVQQLPAQVVTNYESGVTLSGNFLGAFSGNGAGLTNLPVSLVAYLTNSMNTAAAVITNVFTGFPVMSVDYEILFTSSDAATKFPAGYVVTSSAMLASAAYNYAQGTNVNVPFISFYRTNVTTAGGPFATGHWSFYSGGKFVSPSSTANFKEVLILHGN